MHPFTRSYRGTLPLAPAWPALCRRLDLLYIDDSLANWGPQLRRFTQLRELTVRWYGGAAATLDAVLPPDLAQLHTLQRVTLLNVRLATFPAWLRTLPHLQALTLRGTGLLELPDWISDLTQLRTLRLENCCLTALPPTLRQMTSLRELGLSDTALRDFSPAQFPPQLKRLWFHGAGRYVRRDVARLQQALPNTAIWPDLSHPTWPPESRAELR